MRALPIKPGLRIALLICLGIGAGFLLWGCDPMLVSDQFLPGVQIGDIPVQGLTQLQAVAAVEQGMNSLYAQKVTFYREDQEMTYQLGDLCQKPDSAQIVASAWEQEKERSWQDKVGSFSGQTKIDYPAPIPYDVGKRDQLVQEWNAKWGTAPRDASLEVDTWQGLVVVPGQDGFLVDIDTTFQALPLQLVRAQNLRVPIILHAQAPSISAEQLKGMGELSSYTTKYKVSEVNRSHNLALAASHVNKSLVAPGAVFSTNDTVGERSVANGFRDAKIIVGDKFEQGLGGGVCQVSSTLYNAVLLAGLEIVERGNHNLSVAYVPLGLDATVAWGLQDFRFRNTTTAPVYIREVADSGTLTVNIYGDVRFKRHIALSYVVDQTIPYETVVQKDLSLAAGEQKVDHYGQPGYVVRSFRTYYDENGQVVQTDLLSRDYYKPLNKLVLEGPDPPPVPLTGYDPVYYGAV